MKITTLSHCLDIFDWFNDPLCEYIDHVIISKVDGDARVLRALSHLITHAEELLTAHEGTEAAYPTELWNQPA